LQGGKSIELAKSENPNSFYKVPKIKKPLVSASAQLKDLSLKESFLYDIKTNVGEEIILIAK